MNSSARRLSAWVELNSVLRTRNFEQGKQVTGAHIPYLQASEKRAPSKMTKQKQVKKFAAVKRMLNPKDPRL